MGADDEAYHCVFQQEDSDGIKGVKLDRVSAASGSCIRCRRWKLFSDRAPLKASQRQKGSAGALACRMDAKSCRSWEGPHLHASTASGAQSSESSQLRPHQIRE